MKYYIVLEDALRRTAIIHQAHSLKAFLSASFLADKLPSFDPMGWEKCHELIAHDELLTANTLSSDVEKREFNYQRIDGILKRGIFPASYIAMKNWLEHSSIEEIFSFYEKQAIEENEYLLHTVSILLAFKKIWPKLTKQQIPYAIERFTEFVTSTYYNKNHIEYPKNESNYTKQISIENTMSEAMQQPGFWGHNLICLSWLLQCEEHITVEFRDKVLLYIIEQSRWKYTNKGDILNQVKFKSLVGSSDTDKFFDQINALLYDTTRNIHQITLAAALVHLWEYFESTEIKEYLYKIGAYFSSEI